MIKPIVVAGGLLSITIGLPKTELPPFPSIESATKLNWKATVGLTSFRTNILFAGDRLYIGSNGDRFMDRGLIESTSGVYVLNRKTGKQIRHFANEMFGDMDVNGLLAYQDRLYFGNDNEEFLCTDASGKILWRNPTSGDIEHEPVLIKTRNTQHVVYATETGEVKAVDPATGKVQWSYYIPEFDGWRPGENRTVFKIKAWFTSTSYFYTKPLVTDLNNDASDDLIYRSFSGGLIALNGANGNSLWTTGEGETVDIGFSLLGTGKDRKIVSLVDVYSYADNTHRSDIVFFSLSGKKIKTLSLPETDWGTGLNTLRLEDGSILANGCRKTYIIRSNGEYEIIDRSTPYTYEDWKKTMQEGYRNGRESLFANRPFRLSTGKTGVIVMNQHDPASSGGGFLEILCLEDRSVVARLSLPSGSEMPPIIEDVDRDGDLDILIGTYNNNLYCYQLPTF